MKNPISKSMISYELVIDQLSRGRLEATTHTRPKDAEKEHED